MKTSDFKAGDRVKIAPHTDAFMMGMTHGNVNLVGRRFIHVRVDINRRIYKFLPEHLELVS